MSEIAAVLSAIEYEDDDIELDGRLVAGAVTVVHLIDADSGAESIVIKNSRGMGAYTQSGLLSAASQLANQLQEYEEDDG